MRIWITLSAIVILVFCVPGLLLLLPSPNPVALAVYLPLIALAVHDLYYLKILRTDPLRGYRRLAVSQFLLGLIVAVLIARMAYFINNDALWQQLREQTIQITRSGTLPVGTALRHVTDAEWDAKILQVRQSSNTMLIAVAVIGVFSQTLFAWALLRRARKSREADAGRNA